MRVAIVTCYKQPDYIRAQTLRTGLAGQSNVELEIIKNRHTSLLRYPEVMIKLIKSRLINRSDVYLLTFRGYELLPFMCLLTWPKTLIYDEFINPLEWLNEPREQKWVRFVPQTVLEWFYRLLLHRCKFILADTESHAAYSQKLTGAPIAKFFAIPVSTNENLFKDASHPKLKTKSKFRVFYYGNMLPLHGLQFVLDAAVQLKEKPIEFMIIGGGKTTERNITSVKSQGANIIYKSWIDFDQLPNEIHLADVCLGGPFGGTTQANYVITGKTYQFLASGAPTIIGENKATSLFKDQQNCLKVPQQDAAALAKAIDWAYQHPKALAAIGNSGRLLYQANFSQKIVAEKLQTILQALA